MNSAVNLIETPGGVYALAYWLAAVLFISVNKKKMNKWKLVITSIVFLIILVGAMELNHPVSKFWFVPSVLLYVFIIGLFLYVSIKLPIMNIGFYTARAFLVGEFIGSLSWQLFYFSTASDYFSNKVWILIVFAIIAQSVFTMIMLLLEQRFKADERDFTMSRRDFITTVVIVSFIFLFSNLSYLSGNTPFSGQAAEDIFNVRTLIDFGGVALLYAYYIQITEFNTKFEVSKLQNLLKLQVENFEISRKSIDMVNQKYHDLKHYISIMKSAELESGSIEYLNKIETEIKIYEAQNKTGNHVLDTILTTKSIICQSFDAQLSVIADGSLLNKFETMDISTMFGNLLDNAIESVKLIPEKEKRLIHLNISRQKQFILIRLENPYSGTIKYKNGFPITTKTDEFNHGYGLKSVQNTVKKYDGSLTINADQQWFEIRIMIPIKN